jgi:hypothetical protein
MDLEDRFGLLLCEMWDSLRPFSTQVTNNMLFFAGRDSRCGTVDVETWRQCSCSGLLGKPLQRNGEVPPITAAWPCVGCIWACLGLGKGCHHLHGRYCRQFALLSERYESTCSRRQCPAFISDSGFLRTHLYAWPISPAGSNADAKAEAR